MDINQISNLAKQELERQKSTLSLIASENFIHPEALNLSKYPLGNKYSEGYPGRRYYEGCEIVDELESISIGAATKLFGCKYANVQCYSGSIANRAIYQALLNPGERILSMDMASGGHLTHSSPHSFVSGLYEVKRYYVDPETLRINYDNLKEIVLNFRPKLIIAGASSYPFEIYFKIFRDLADLVGAYLLADICHLSGLIVSNLHPHCFPYAHVAMTTTHKQLRGARGAVILWNDESLSAKINKAVFPGNQGGPNQLAIAQNAVAFLMANTDEYRQYMRRVKEYSKILAHSLKDKGVKVIGTETHLFLIDTMESFGKSGSESAKLLSAAGIITNSNFLPYDSGDPKEVSGIRMGTCILALLDSDPNICFKLSEWIYSVLSGHQNSELVQKEIKYWLNNLEDEQE